MSLKFPKLILLIFCALFLIAAAPFQAEPPDLTDLAGVLLWLSGAGAAYVVGQVVSYLAENWPKWHNLPTSLKIFAPLILSPVISILATIGLQYGAQIDAVAPWWSIVVYSIVTYLATQHAHAAQKLAGYGSTAKTLAAESAILNQEPQGRG